MVNAIARDNYEFLLYHYSSVFKFNDGGGLSVFNVIYALVFINFDSNEFIVELMDGFYVHHFLAMYLESGYTYAAYYDISKPWRKDKSESRLDWLHKAFIPFSPSQVEYTQE